MRERWWRAWALVVFHFGGGETADALQRPQNSGALNDDLVAARQPIDHLGASPARQRLDRHRLVMKGVRAARPLLAIHVGALFGIKQRRGGAQPPRDPRRLETH